MTYCFTKTVKMDWDKAVEHVTKHLAEEGFGILTQIDVKKTLKEKLDKDYHPYLILGACNPNYAHQALETENKIGVMLPCNVILQDLGNGQIEVSIVDPLASMQAVKNEKLAEIAGIVRDKLQKVAKLI